MWEIIIQAIAERREEVALLPDWVRAWVKFMRILFFSGIIFTPWWRFSALCGFDHGVNRSGNTFGKSCVSRCGYDCGWNSVAVDFVDAAAGLSVSSTGVDKQ